MLLILISLSIRQLIVVDIEHLKNRKHTTPDRNERRTKNKRIIVESFSVSVNQNKLTEVAFIDYPTDANENRENLTEILTTRQIDVYIGGTFVTN